MRAFLLTLLTILMLPLSGFAQSTERPNTILVLDGSGSMWGQIDGVNKIVIARNVIAELLADMADDVSLGLTVYGHRERGSCTDIETIVAPAPFTQDRILEAVNAINPRGRTPMTDAVVAAAQSLRSTEEPATVILVSDGIENCNPDPCAIAAELEAAGVAFTAHVIGFDVASEPEARAQMQCIADATGGQFLTADNATELSAALEQIVEVVMPVQTRIEAVVVPQMTAPTHPVVWTVLGADGAVVAAGIPGPAILADLLPGDYVAQATRSEPTGPVTYQTAFTVLEAAGQPVQVVMPAIVETSQLTFLARVEPDMSVPTSALAWTLYDAADAVVLGPLVAPSGDVALLPGEYRLQVESASTGTRHEARFTIEANTPLEVIIPLPAVLVDITFVARIGDVGGLPVTDPVVWDVTPLGQGAAIAGTNPTVVSLGRGAYRVTAYWTAQEIEQSVDFVVVDQAREIVVVFPAPLAQATVTAPATAVAGSTIEVGWTGPDYQNDFIGVGRADAEEAEQWQNYTRTSEGSPLRLVMPTEPGAYMIRYFVDQDRTALAEVQITLTPAQATLTVPATAVAGSSIEVGWTGPDYPNDFIGVGSAGAEGAEQWQNYTRTSDGSPLRLVMPTEPGAYVIRYFVDQDRTVLAEAQITLTSAQATLTLPATAVAGSSIEVGWTGPDYPNDFIGVGRAGAEGAEQWQNYTRTSDGSPLRLVMPTEPGTYQIRYFVDQDRSILADAQITLTAATATLTATATAAIGSSVEVAWTGPDYPNDFIGVGRADAEGAEQWQNYTRTSDGSPMRLVMPTEPGAYVIRYFVDQDRRVLAEVPITLTDVAATLTAPDTAAAGSQIQVDWTGPNYPNDYIGIGLAGATDWTRWEQYTRTADGSPLSLTMPDTPGTYVIRYFVDQNNRVLAERQITVQ